jgi:hypothetical protein
MYVAVPYGRSMKNPIAVASALALAIVAVGCGGPTPESVCAKLKDLESLPQGCEGVWAAKKQTAPKVFDKQAACVLKAVTGAEAAICQAP